MTKMNHVLLYGNYEDLFRMLPEAEAGRLVIGMLHYLNTGEEYNPKRQGKYIWKVIKDQIDRNIQKYEEVCERNRSNAQKYWDKQKNATGTGSD